MTSDETSQETVRHLSIGEIQLAKQLEELNIETGHKNDEFQLECFHQKEEINQVEQAAKVIVIDIITNATDLFSNLTSSKFK